jgi:hypothetical protein
LLRVIDHPEWLDLSDRTLVLLGAGSEAGPLEWLSRWRANIVAVDLPGADVWRRIVATVNAGNARLIAPARGPSSCDRSADAWPSQVGADLLTETPEIAAWLETLDRPLDLAAIAYLDGERHVRVAMAMDALMARRGDSGHERTLMFMATPTDVFAVAPPVAEVLPVFPPVPPPAVAFPELPPCAPLALAFPARPPSPPLPALARSALPPLPPYPPVDEPVASPVLVSPRFALPPTAPFPAAPAAAAPAPPFGLPPLPPLPPWPFPPVPALALP